ncbi:MAG: M48 family metallopeptidase [Alphaproteobacteria bacterium]
MAPTYAGQYNDGRTAARIEVRIVVTNDGLDLYGADDRRFASWSFDDLTVSGERPRSQPLRLTNESQAGARLTVEDKSILRPIYALAPQLRAQGPFGARPWLRVAAWGVGIGAAVATLIFVVPRLAEPVAALVPVEWEEVLGKEIVESALSEHDVCTGAAGTRALARLSDRLAATVTSPYDFTVRVADIGEANAFAAPGGQVVLLRGLIDAAGSPDEVAGVLAHEMAHVIERHPTESIVRAAGIALMFQILIGDLSGLLALAAEFGEGLLNLSYNRGDEAEADELGVAMLEGAGIRTDGLVAFLSRAADEEGALGGALAFLSSHPPSRERAVAVLATAGRGGSAMSSSEWTALGSICD